MEMSILEVQNRISWVETILERMMPGFKPRMLVVLFQEIILEYSRTWNCIE